VADLVTALTELLGDERTLGLALPEWGRERLSTHVHWLLGVLDTLPSELCQELLVQHAGTMLAGWYLLRREPVPDEIPRWVETRDDFLVRFAAERGFDRKRMQRLAAVAGGSRIAKRVLDGLLSGADTPSDDVMTRLARLLTGHETESWPHVLGRLRAHYAARRLYEDLEARVGTGTAREWVDRVLERARLVAIHFVQAAQQGRLGDDRGTRDAYVELSCQGVYARCERFDFEASAEVPGFYSRDVATVIAEHEHPRAKHRRELGALETKYGTSSAIVTARAHDFMIDMHLAANSDSSRAGAYTALLEGRHQLAVALLTDLLVSLPNDMPAHVFLAYALETCGKRERAVELLLGAPGAVRAHPSTKLQLAAMYLRAEDYEHAQPELEAVLEAFPNGPEHAAAQELYAFMHAGLGQPQLAAAAARAGRPFLRWLLEQRPRRLKAL
jgi:tetratricopeptide (TPR) repeat protein